MGDHYRSLERMYMTAPVNQIFKPSISVSEERAEIVIDVDEAYHHAAGAVHGAVYFKMLDDAAFFAANSIEEEYFVLTVSFTTYLTRPISSGQMRSVGKVVDRTHSQIIAEAVVFDGNGKEIGRGNGIFSRGRLRLVDAMGYGDAR